MEQSDQGSALKELIKDVSEKETYLRSFEGVSYQ